MLRIDRRAFNRLSALALAGARVPSFAQSGTQPATQPAAPTPAAQQPVGYAAIGLGAVSDIFMRACANSKTAKITALVTGHPDTKGKKYAAMYGIPETSIYTYETFDRIAGNKAVDAVYVGLPNSMHREYTVRAARAGKHVFCEKPMAISSGECEAMTSATRNSNLLLMVGYRIHYDPTHLAAQRIVQSGALGQLQAFEGTLGYYTPAGAWRLTKALGGGGSLMDLGIYPLNEVRWFANEEPSEFTAVAATRDHNSGRFNEVEQTLAWTMEFPSGIVASLTCSYGENIPGFLRIHGDKGSLQIDNAYFYSGAHLTNLGSGKPVDLLSQHDQTFQFQLEAEHFAECIRTGATPDTPGEDGLNDLLAIESIYKAAGTPIA
jgi:predicted dehydrogenase